MRRGGGSFYPLILILYVRAVKTHGLAWIGVAIKKESNLYHPVEKRKNLKPFKRNKRFWNTLYTHFACSEPRWKYFEFSNISIEIEKSVRNISTHFLFLTFSVSSNSSCEFEMLSIVRYFQTNYGVFSQCRVGKERQVNRLIIQQIFSRLDR